MAVTAARLWALWCALVALVALSRPAEGVCAAEGIWPSTANGEVAVRGCHSAEDTFGLTTRSCGESGAWATADASGCVSFDGFSCLQSVSGDLDECQVCAPGLSGSGCVDDFLSTCAQSGTTSTANLGDGVCDSDLNILACGFDAGDCCSPSCGCPLNGYVDNACRANCTGPFTCEDPCFKDGAVTCTSPPSECQQEQGVCVGISATDAACLYKPKSAGTPCTGGECDGGGYCVKTCPANGAWPVTKGGTMRQIPCAEGFNGDRTRECLVVYDADAVTAVSSWEAANEAACVPFCAAEGLWSATDAGLSQTIGCPDGAPGTRSRKCNSSVLWEDVVDSCDYRKCPAEDGWPATPTESDASLECEEPKVGTQKRPCTNGAWGEVDLSGCVPLCPADDGFAKTAPGAVAEKPCGTGYMGTVDRRCQDTGEWEAPDNSSCSRFCPAGDAWSSTPVNSMQQVPCGGDVVGFMTRNCLADAVWSEVNDTLCEYFCPQIKDLTGNVVYPVTPKLTLTTSPCTLGNTSFNEWRFCDAQGSWSEANTSECVIPRCPEDGKWPSTQVGQVASIDCPFDRKFKQYRECVIATESWGEANSTLCRAPRDPRGTSSESGFADPTTIALIVVPVCIILLVCTTRAWWNHREAKRKAEKKQRRLQAKKLKQEVASSASTEQLISPSSVGSATRMDTFQVMAPPDTDEIIVTNMGNGLPDGWQQFEDESGTPYYFNDRTQETTWNRPL